MVREVLGKMQRTLPSHVDADDLHGAGVMGLVAAVERYVTEQSHTFSGYAYISIRGAILDELRRMDICSRRVRQRAKPIDAAIETKAQILGRVPTDEEVSAELQIPVADLQKWRERASAIRVVSLDACSETDASTGGWLHEIIPDNEQQSVREVMEKEDLLKLLTQRIADLPELQKKVLAMYYFEEMRFAEIGVAFDLTESRICQIHKQAVTKLRAHLRSEALA